MNSAANRLLAAAALLALTALPARAELTAHERALYEAAKPEGELTWYTSQFASAVADAMGKGFEEKFPGIKVNVVRTTAQVAFQRLSADMKAGMTVCDVFGSTDSGHDAYLKSKDLLLKYVPENASKVSEPFQNFDPDGFYHITAVGLVLITYNTQKVAAADAPKNWTDLLDPKWKDRVSTGHPGFSGFVGVWAATMNKLYGEDFFRRLEKNSPQIGRSINDTVTMLASGERWVAFGSSNATSNAIARGNPLAIVYPTDGAVLVISASAIMKGTRHPNAAKLFMEYLLSEDAAKVSASHQYQPLRPEVAPPAGMRRLSEVKVIRPSEAEIQKGIPEVKEVWRDVFGN